MTDQTCGWCHRELDNAGAGAAIVTRQFVYDQAPPSAEEFDASDLIVDITPQPDGSFEVSYVSDAVVRLLGASDAAELVGITDRELKGGHAPQHRQLAQDIVEGKLPSGTSVAWWTHRVSRQPIWHWFRASSAGAQQVRLQLVNPLVDQPLVDRVCDRCYVAMQRLITSLAG